MKPPPGGGAAGSGSTSLFHVEQILGHAEGAGIPFDEERAASLVRFTELLEARAVRLGIVGRSDAGRIGERHVLDCLRAAAIIEAGDRQAYDLGAGAGLPGIVLAVAVPGCRFVLVERNRRRAGFLELAVERLKLPNAEVVPAGVEDLEGRVHPADLCTARAFAPLDRAWAAAWPLLRRGGRLVYFAGSGLRDPESTARATSSPEPPVAVEVNSVLATAAPLIIMTRR